MRVLVERVAVGRERLRIVDDARAHAEKPRREIVDGCTERLSGVPAAEGGRVPAGVAENELGEGDRERVRIPFERRGEGERRITCRGGEDAGELVERLSDELDGAALLINFEFAVGPRGSEKLESRSQDLVGKLRDGTTSEVEAEEQRAEIGFVAGAQCLARTAFELAEVAAIAVSAGGKAE